MKKDKPLFSDGSISCLQSYEGAKGSNESHCVFGLSSKGAILPLASTPGVTRPAHRADGITALSMAYPDGKVADELDSESSVSTDTMPIDSPGDDTLSPRFIASAPGNFEFRIRGRDAERIYNWLVVGTPAIDVMPGVLKANPARTVAREVRQNISCRADRSVAGSSDISFSCDVAFDSKGRALSF
jgi:hypothetical protein